MTHVAADPHPRTIPPPVRQATVGDIMSSQPVVVRSDASIELAASLLAEHGFAGLPVIDPGGALVGVISETDVVRIHSTDYLWAHRHHLLVRHLMTAPAVAVHRSTPVELAARRMRRHQVHRLVVVADDDELRPIGVISASDLVRAIVGERRDP
jgi:CBS domain-containing protein